MLPGNFIVSKPLPGSYHFWGHLRSENYYQVIASGSKIIFKNVDRHEICLGIFIRRASDLMRLMRLMDLMRETDGIHYFFKSLLDLLPDVSTCKRLV